MSLERLSYSVSGGMISSSLILVGPKQVEAGAARHGRQQHDHDKSLEDDTGPTRRDASFHDKTRSVTPTKPANAELVPN